MCVYKYIYIYIYREREMPVGGASSLWPHLRLRVTSHRCCQYPCIRSLCHAIVVVNVFDNTRHMCHYCYACVLSRLPLLACARHFVCLSLLWFVVLASPAPIGGALSSFPSRLSCSLLSCSSPRVSLPRFAALASSAPIRGAWPLCCRGGFRERMATSGTGVPGTLGFPETPEYDIIHYQNCLLHSSILHYITV